MSLERPIFVGGTGRSGTTVAGRLLNVHPELALTRPRELRFIASSRGLAEAYWTETHGRIPRIKRSPSPNPIKRVARVFIPRKVQPRKVTPEMVVKHLWTHWYERDKPSGLVSGLNLALSREELEAIANEYLAAFEADPYAASRAMVAAVLAPQLRGREGLRVVDTTPANARAADRMLALFPDAKILHMMRDGRDVAASFSHKKFGPQNVMLGLEEWRMRMIDSHRAEQACPPGSVIRIDLQRLVVTHRKETFTRLVNGLELTPNPTFRKWFEGNVLPAEAKPGRWRKDFSDEQCKRIDQRYNDILDELRGRGVPVPVRADESMRGMRAKRDAIRRERREVRRTVESAPAADSGASPAAES